MEKNTRNIAPMKLELLMAVVHNNKAAYFSSLIQSHKANLQLTVPAKGTTHLILDYLGLTERPKTLITSVVRSDQAGRLIELLDDTFRTTRASLSPSRCPASSGPLPMDS